jgi:hypothetical protein
MPSQQEQLAKNTNYKAPRNEITFSSLLDSQTLRTSLFSYILNLRSFLMLVNEVSGPCKIILSRVGVTWRMITLLDRMFGFIDPSLYKPYSAIADLHTFKFHAAHALGFSVSTSRCLVADLNIKTITSNHYEVFLSFLLQSLRTNLTKPGSSSQKQNKYMQQRSRIYEFCS